MTPEDSPLYMIAKAIDPEGLARFMRKSPPVERLLNAAARSAALQAFLPLRPYTVRRPVPVVPTGVDLTIIEGNDYRSEAQP